MAGTVDVTCRAGAQDFTHNRLAGCDPVQARRASAQSGRRRRSQIVSVFLLNYRLFFQAS